MEPDSASPESPLATASRRCRELRKRRGMNADKLAERLQSLGFSNWSRGTVIKFESGRRQSLSVEEMYGLAMALDCSVTALIVPLDDRPVQVTPTRVENANAVRAWVVGTEPLPGVDEYTYRTEISIESLRGALRTNTAVLNVPAIRPTAGRTTSTPGRSSTTDAG